VIGASSGIGWAVAERLATDHRVAAISRRATGPAGCLCLRGDVTDARSLGVALAEAADTHGPVRVLVVCAGRMEMRPMLQTSEHLFQELLSVNVFGAARAVSAVLPAMVAARTGRIVLLSSPSALLGAPGQTAYAASKGVLIGLARGLAAEVGGQGVAVNAVVPGFVQTPMTAQVTGAQRTALIEAAPLARAISASEVAEAVAFLAGAAAVNGSVLLVDGGLGAAGGGLRWT
jgi:NAD(P)-dependent dehydrogenase (short-subunit alcohol dehydrogenase family)